MRGKKFRGYRRGLFRLVTLDILEEPPDFLFNTIIIFIFRFFIAHIGRVAATVGSRDAFATSVTVFIGGGSE